MTNNRTVFTVVALVAQVVIVVAANFYFMYYLNSEEAKLSAMRALEDVIRAKMRHLKPVYINRNPRFFMYRNKLLRNYKPAPYENVSMLWDIANSWPRKNEIYPMYDSSMGQLLQSLRVEPITKAQILPRGRQLKILLKLANQQEIVFKPQWYDRDVAFDGPVHSGKDRHTAEIYAFYLGAVLNFRWTPIAVGRHVNLKELYDKADVELKNTMAITKGENSTQYCVYGKCPYCNDNKPVCGDENNIIEGVLLYLIPGTLARIPSPWKRTYIAGVKAPWENNINYCKPLKKGLETTRLLDFIDVAIFDYLIQNGDRHNLDIREKRVVLIDNGKAFGNPNKDFLDILAPLYQCCMLRKTTWDRLQVFSGGVLTDLIDRLSKPDPLHPLITNKHKRGVERRLLVVYAVVEYCMDIYDDKMFMA